MGSAAVDEIKEMAVHVLRENGVCRAALFGSMVTGEDSSGSDVDMLVEFEGKKSLLDLAGLKIALEDLLGRKVDVITYGSLNPLLRDRI
ncbi:hypothetical protein LCGC14_2954060, partial [marine sediment metagenome]